MSTDSLGAADDRELSLGDTELIAEFAEGLKTDIKEDGKLSELFAAQVKQRLESIVDVGVANNRLAQATTEGIEYFEQLEEMHPGLWDNFRLRLAIELVEAKGYDDALRLMHAVRTPHIKVDIARVISGGDNLSSALWTRHLLESNLRHDPAMRIACLRAFRDRLILTTPDSYLITQIETELRTTGVEPDTFIGWIESQALELPDADWEDVVLIIENDDLWSVVIDSELHSVNLRDRQYCMALLLMLDYQCAYGEVDSNLLKMLWIELRPAEDGKTDMPVRNELRVRCARTLLDHGLHEDADMFIDAITDNKVRATLST